MPYSNLALLMLCTQGVWGIGAFGGAPIVTVKENQCYNWSKPGGENNVCCTVLVVLGYPLTFYPACNICSPLFSLFCSPSGKCHLGVMWSLALWFQSMSVCWTASWGVPFPRSELTCTGTFSLVLWIIIKKIIYIWYLFKYAQLCCSLNGIQTKHWMFWALGNQLKYWRITGFAFLSLSYLESAHCLHERQQPFCCCIKTASNNHSRLAVIPRARLFRPTTLEFYLYKFYSILV